MIKLKTYMIEKEFAPYTEALELKQLGFDEHCLAWYGPSGKFLADITIGYEKTDWLYNQQDMDNPRECIAPTYSQAFRWFREKHKLHSHISLGISDEQDRSGLEYDEYIYVIEGLSELEYDNYGESSFYKTPEEAELACLKKLIEIVKQK